MNWQNAFSVIMPNEGSTAMAANLSAATSYHIYRDYAMGNVNQALVTITCILSMLGSVTIIATFIAWKDIRTVTRHVLLCLSISDFLIVLGNICGTYFVPSSVDVKCRVQSFVTTSASIISCFWTTTLALYLYITVVKGKQILARRLLVFFHLMNWSVGPFINFIAISQKMLGNSSDEITAGWCWIYHSGDPDDRRKEILWMLFDGKLAEFLAYGSILVLYILIKMKLRNELKLRSRAVTKKPMKALELKAARTADRKLIFIPVLLILARFWGTLRFLLFCADVLPKHTSSHLSIGHKILLTLQGIGDSSQGMLNCILFCLCTPTVYNRLKDFFLEKICCFRPRRLKSHISTQTVGKHSSLANGREKNSSEFTDPLLSNGGMAKSYGAAD